jgi:hypothetical protein
MSLIVRPYDRAFSPELLDQVKRRRLNPDGVERHVKRVRGRDGYVNRYPWDEMLLGDYFYADLDGNHFSGMRTRFKQVALRRDFEVTCARWDLGSHANPRPAIRVCLSYTGSVRALKEKAGIRVTDGRWTKTRRDRAKGGVDEA